MRSQRSRLIQSTHPERKEVGTFAERKEIGTFAATWKSFKRQTTAHGVPHIDNAQGKLKKIFWCTISLGCLSFLVFHIATVGLRFSSRPVSVNIKLIKQTQMIFPAVTVCNMNPIKSSALSSSTKLLSVLGDTSVSGNRKRKKRAAGDTIATYDGNGDFAPCVLPFSYLGVSHDSCIGDPPWCSTTSDCDVDGLWGYCIVQDSCPNPIYISPSGEEVCYWNPQPGDKVTFQYALDKCQSLGASMFIMDSAAIQSHVTVNNIVVTGPGKRTWTWLIRTDASSTEWLWRGSVATGWTAWSNGYPDNLADLCVYVEGSAREMKDNRDCTASDGLIICEKLYGGEITAQPTTLLATTTIPTTLVETTSPEETTVTTTVPETSTEQTTTVQPTTELTTTMESTTQATTTTPTTTMEITTQATTTTPTTTMESTTQATTTTPTTTMEITTESTTTTPTTTMEITTEATTTTPTTTMERSTQVTTTMPTTMAPSTTIYTTVKTTTAEPTTMAQTTTTKPTTNSPTSEVSTTESTTVATTPTESTTDTPTTTTTPATTTTTPFPTEVREDFRKREEVMEVLADMPVEEKKSLGFRVDELVVDCEYAGYTCQASQFNFFYDAMHGNCYMFNSAWNDSHDIHVSYQPGRRHGLKLIININQNEYLENLGEEAGASIVVHHQSRMPFPQDEGILASPGQLTAIGIRQVEMTRVGDPYGECADTDIKNITRNVYEEMYKVNYSTNGCLKTCYQKLMIKICGCMDPQLPIVGQAFKSANICTTYDKELCKVKIDAHYSKDSDLCDCPSSCREKSYLTDVSNVRWPSDVYENKIISNMASKLGPMSADYTDPDIFRNNFLKVEVFFQDFSFEIIKETPAYTEASLFSDLGGILGLWVGCSVLSLFEFIELFVDFSVLTCLAFFTRHLTRKKPKKILSSSSPPIYPSLTKPRVENPEVESDNLGFPRSHTLRKLYAAKIKPI